MMALIWYLTAQEEPSAAPLIIGVARAVQWTMTNGGLVDPLVHGLSNLMRSASAYVSTVGMFIAKFLLSMP